jgi:integrase/ketosteroid isomerase-like protein
LKADKKSRPKRDLVEAWRNKIAMRSEGSAYVYVQALGKFLKWKKTTPEETLRWTPEGAAREMVSYIGILKKEGKADKYLATIWYALKSWFADNGMRKIKVDEKVPVKQQVNLLDRIPTKEDLKRILDCASMQTKAMISMMAFAGMRPKDASELTYSSIKEDYEAEVTPMAIYHRVSKTGGLWHVAFLTSQGAGYLREWIEYRKAEGEGFEDDTPLFINLKSKGSARIGARGLEQAVVEAMRRAGWRKKDERFRCRPYGLRKYFRANLTNIDPDFREYLVAHKSGVNSLVATYDGLRDLYKPTIEKLREQFKRAEPSLNTETAATEDMKRDLLLTMWRDQAKMFGIDPMKIRIERGKELEAEEEIEAIQNEIKRLRMTPKTYREESDCDGNSRKYESKLIDESALVQHLNGGWDVVKEFRDGRIVVRKEI